MRKDKSQIDLFGGAPKELTPDELKKRIGTDDKFAVHCLMKLVGGGYGDEFLKGCAKFLKNKKYLSKKQLAAVKVGLQQYSEVICKMKNKEKTTSEQ